MGLNAFYFSFTQNISIINEEEKMQNKKINLTN